jgi:hypothetical protein
MKIQYLIGLLFCAFVLSGCSTTGTVKGSVMFDGAAQQGTVVELKSEHGSTTTRTDRDGKFEFADVDPGEYLLEVTLDFPPDRCSFMNSEVEVRAGRVYSQKFDIDSKFISGKMLQRLPGDLLMVCFVPK